MVHLSSMIRAGAVPRMCAVSPFACIMLSRARRCHPEERSDEGSLTSKAVSNCLSESDPSLGSE